MRIVIISGVWCPVPLDWHYLCSAFEREISNSTCITETEVWCHPWQSDRLKRFAHRLSRKIDDGEETLLVGHSMGGVIACAASRLLSTHNVCAIVTIHSPHQFLGGWFTRLLDAAPVSVPVISFSGSRDELVWWGSKHPQAIHHERHCSNHYGDLVESPQSADLIARTTAHILQRNRR